MKRSPEILEIKELDLDLLQPTLKTMYKEKQGGMKIVVIGKPGTGKSFLLSSLLYAKKHIFPVGQVHSGSEDSNHFYSSIFPSTFVFNKLQEERLVDFRKRQKIARRHLENPWALVLLDDCTDEPSILRKPLFQDYFKNGRHWKMWFILSLQYCMDILPSIRTNIDGIFILREANIKNRKSLYENYAGIIPEFSIFNALMDQITDDYTALYIHNMGHNNRWQDNVFWYKAPQIPENFKFGCPEYHEFHRARYNPNYVDPLY